MIKTSFSIKDLEAISGIKIPTIRIWEKRYKLLEPKRTKTNIRVYDVANAKKLLNIVYLNKNGYKISKIAKIKPKQLSEYVKQLSITKNENQPIEVNLLLMSMFNYDKDEFNDIYKRLRKDYDFEHLYELYFIPLLIQIGLLWQTDVLHPSNEHFISCLITQKISAEIELLNCKHNSKDKNLFVLYLPLNEIHEISLLFTYFMLCKYNFNAIYIGSNINIEELNVFESTEHQQVNLVTNLTSKPNQNEVNVYLKKIDKYLLKQKINLFVSGYQIANSENPIFTSDRINLFENGKTLIEHLT